MARFGFSDWLSGTKQADGGYAWGTAPATPGPQTSANSQSVTDAQSPAALAAAATPYDARLYGSAEAQVTGLSGGDTIAFTRSLDGTNYATVSWIDQTFATGSTISANGIYSFPGGGYLKWTQTGSASTPTVTVRAAS
jgi:hypothetical protein